MGIDAGQPAPLAAITAAPEPTFEQSYTHPHIASETETGIAGLKIIWVYASPVEDPIIPRPWFRTASGKTLNASRVDLALAEAGFHVKTEADALRAAKVASLTGTYGRLVESVPPELTADGGAALTVTPPKATAQGNAFEVVQYFFRPPTYLFNQRRPGELVRVKFLVGEGLFRTRGVDVLWASEAQEPPKPGPSTR